MKIVTLALLCLLFPMSLLAQSSSGSLNLVGSGARAAGMSGAFIGVADDATAISWNPAGLSQLERPEISAVFQNSSQSTDFSVPDFDITEKVSFSNFYPNFFSAAFPLKLGEASKLVFAASYQRIFNDYAETEIGDSKSSARGGVDAVSPGIAFSPVPFISIGAVGNIWFGSSEYTSSEPGLSSQSEYTYSGFNLNFGLLADFEALGEGKLPLKLGVSYKMPFDMGVEISGDDADSRLTDFKMEMPSMFGFGASFRLGENLTIAADYEMRGFGDSKYKWLFNGNPQDDPVSASGENLNQFRVGAEYLAVFSSLVIPVRVGFQTYPTLEANMNTNYDAESQVVGSSFSVGSGLILSSLAFDVAASFTSFTQTVYIPIDLGFPVGTVPVKVEAKQSMTNLIFSAIYYF